MNYFEFKRKFMIRISDGKGSDYEQQRCYIFEKGVSKEPVPDEVVKSNYFERLVQLGEIVPIGDFTLSNKQPATKIGDAPSLNLSRGDGIQMVGPEAGEDAKVKKVKKGKA